MTIFDWLRKYFKTLVMITGVVCLANGLVKPVYALTPAGDTVANDAEIIYQNTPISDTFTLQSNTVLDTVNKLYQPGIYPLTASDSVFLGETIIYVHIVRNDGNTPDSFDLTGMSNNFWGTGIYQDGNEDSEVSSADTLITNSGDLLMGETIVVIFAVRVPDTAFINYKQTIQDFDTLISTSVRENTTSVSTYDSGVIYQLPLDHFVLSVPSINTAGISFVFSITAENKLNRTLPLYDDTAAILADVTITPSTADTPFTSTGYDTVGAVITVTGTHTITVTDGNTISETTLVYVQPALADSFLVEASVATITAGSSFNLLITAIDAFRNVAANYNNTASIAASSGTITPDTTNNFVSGTTTISVTLTKSGTITLTLNDGAISGTTQIYVTGASVTTFEVSAPASVTAGETFVLYITSKDKFDNISSFGGTTSLTISGGAVTPAKSNNFQSGIDTEVVTLTLTGNLVLTVTDAGSGSFGTVSIQVSPAAINSFDITADSSIITAGVNFILSITAKDAFNNIAASYSSSAVFLTSRDTMTPIATGNFTAGTNSLAVSITSAGVINITSLDPSSGSSGNVNVTIVPGALDHFLVNSPDTAFTAGENFTLVATALDSYNNPVTSYNTGAYVLVSSGSIAPSVTGNFSAGTVTVTPVTVTRAGTIGITVTDGAGKNGDMYIFVRSSAAIDRFVISVPAQVTAGKNFVIIITGYDFMNNIVNTLPNDTAVLSLSSGTIFPETIPFQLDITGTASLTVSISKSGTIIITLNNTQGAAPGSDTTFSNPNKPDHFNVATNVLVITAGVGFAIDITAEDLFNNQAVSYTDTVEISAGNISGSQTINPGISQIFVNGIRTEYVTVTRAETLTITVRDTVLPDSGVTGALNIYVTPGELGSIELAIYTVYPQATVPFDLTITAYDTYSNIKTNFNNPLLLSMSGTNAIRPETTTAAFVNGVLTQSVTVATGGVPATITATDAASNISGTISKIIIGTSVFVLSNGIDTVGYAGKTTYIPFTISNFGTSIDTYIITASTLFGTDTHIYMDGNKNGKWDNGETTEYVDTNPLYPNDILFLFIAVTEPSTMPLLVYDTVNISVQSGFDSTGFAANTNTLIIASPSLAAMPQVNITTSDVYSGPTKSLPYNGVFMDIIVQAADADQDGKIVAPPQENVEFYADNSNDTIVHDTMAFFGRTTLHYRTAPAEEEQIVINGYLGGDSYPIIVVEPKRITFVVPAPDYSQVIVPFDAIPADEFIGIKEVKGNDLKRLEKAHSMLSGNYALTRIPVTKKYIPHHDFGTTMSKDKFSKPVTVIIPYLDENNDGIVDNTEIVESTLRIYMLENGSEFWDIVPGSKVHATENYVEADVNHFTIFTLMGSPTTNNLSQTASYPNPFMLSDPGFNEGKRTITINTFTNVTRLTVRIYNVAGTLVRTLNEGDEIESMSPGIAIWDGRNDAGEYVASGVYIYVIDSDQGQTVQKLTVIK